MPATATLQPATTPAAEAPAPAAVTTPDEFLAALIAAHFNFTTLTRTIPAAHLLPLLRSPEVRAAIDELAHFSESCAALRSAELRELALAHLATIIADKTASPIETRRAATTILRAAAPPPKPRQPREPIAPREPHAPREPRPPHNPSDSPRAHTPSASTPAAPAPAKSAHAEHAPPESVAPAALALAPVEPTTTVPSAREVLTTFLARLATANESDPPTNFHWINHAVSGAVMLNGKCPRKANDGFASTLWPHLRKYTGHPAGQIANMPTASGADATLEFIVTFPKSKTRPTELALRFVLLPSQHTLTRPTWLVAAIITTLEPTNTS